MSFESQSDNQSAGGTSSAFPVVALLRGLAGAAVGAVLGFFGFDYLWSQGFYSAILPGALVGLGFGLAARQPMNVFGVLSLLIAVPASLVSEWKGRYLPEVTFSEFISALGDEPVSIAMHVIGAIAAFWFGRGR